jgi:RNA polymerase sigma factor for flagellar operon FliA
VCRRHYLPAADAEDFASEVRLHILEKNCEPLRRFEGRCTLSTFLTVVVNNLYLDYRNRQWGKWRPSAEAKRLGALAILIEKLVTRDGWTLEQAIEMVHVNHQTEIDEATRARFAQLTQRAPQRQFVGEIEADGIESPAPAPDANVLRAEQDFVAKRVQTALDRVRQTLEPAEQIVLKMRFEDGAPVADIARALHLNQKRLYRTIDQLLARLRKGLEAEGIDREEVRSLFADWSFGAVGADGAPSRAGAAGIPHRQNARGYRG